MANNVGCKSGKTILVDPNKFEGQNSFDNMSVPIEDLNISVELTASRKERTVLVTKGNGGTFINEGSNIDEVKIRFLEGSKVNGQQVLTTSYTDLTTSFDKGNNGESLGITNIDVDFTSAYAPSITISFIDVRGSAIFQNEQNAANDSNKYSVFFQLPYPLYQLTIKGYYGKPVKYCLHMTKFNSRFNSNTGNFEITASYIGYTYAMLTDMLIGYLKVIPYTKLGAARFEEMKKEDSTLMTLLELSAGISKINTLVEKIKADDPDSKSIAVGINKTETLSTIETTLNILGSNIDINAELGSYRYAIMQSTSSVPNAGGVISTTPQSAYAPPSLTTSNASPSLTSSIKTYNDNIIANIAEYNKGNSFTIDETDFTSLNKQLVQGVSLEMLNPNNFDVLNTNLLRTKFNGATDFDKKRRDMFDFIKSHGGIGEKQLLDVYDLNKQYDLIVENRNKINAESLNLRKALAQTMKNKVSKALGFDPTIRNIVKIFCAHVEIFLGVIYDVSTQAKNSTERTKELKKFSKPNSFDQSINESTSSGDAVGGLSDQFYPWPEYRKGDDINGLTETYLGELGVLTNPKNVDELRFVDDLLEAFLTAAKLEEQIGNQIGAEETNWYPISPLDTRLFINKAPYNRIKGLSRNEVINLMVIRGMIFMGYSNKDLTNEEIQMMANLEADAVFNDIIEEKVIQNFTQVSLKDFIDATGTINDKKTKIIKPHINVESASAGYMGIGATTGGVTFDGYTYDFIPPSDRVLITLSGGVNTSDTSLLPTILPLTWSTNNSIWNPEPNALAERAETDVFLTNYSNINTPYTLFSPKVYDGGVYVKIMSIDEYNSMVKPLPANATVTDGVINLEKLKQTEVPADVGYNPFGGAYGIQEFSKLDYGVEELNGLSLSYVFYNNTDDGTNGNKSNGLAYTRIVSGPNAATNTTSSKYDVTPTKYLITDNIQDLQDLIDGPNKPNLHKNYGKNRELIKEYLTNIENVTYPYINFQTRSDQFIGNTANDWYPISLFGSRLYYKQSESQYPKYAKALLFLHTFPWNGLHDGASLGQTIFDVPEIRNLFSNRAGFIKVPKLWAAFIGGMLWRADILHRAIVEDGIIVGGGSQGPDPIVFRDPITDEHLVPESNNITSPYPGTPDRDEYIKAINSRGSMTFNGSPAGLDYLGVQNFDKVLINLPDQAKDEFKSIFFKFVSVNGGVSDWDMISGQLEIFDGNGAGWEAAYNAVMGTVIADELNTSVMKTVYNANYNGLSNFDNYIMVAPIKDNDEFKYNYILELKGGAKDNQAVKTLIDNLVDEVVIMNTNYMIWQTGEVNTSTLHKGIDVRKDKVDLYFKTLVERFNNNKNAITADSKKKEEEQNLFGTSDENIIKFNLYRTIKGIYDKWVGGAEDDNIIFQCGDRSATDIAMAKKTRGEKAVPRLIDSFRFVSRSFQDIGDNFIVNPLPVNDYLIGNPNTSVYDAIGSLLSANNFDFVPLPSFINYNDESELANMFKPISYNEAFAEGVSGPSFVCVYVGQSSKNLDFGNSNYPNDGFDVQCDGSGGMINALPNDFTLNAEEHENNVAVFAVNYGQQNQNIFRDITLDQSEFGTTDESLQITEDISQKGASTNRSFVGQNIFNVYQTRSYKVEVEMMGNAMVQPMMYFQLNNIPMYHGAYMITSVKHHIKPNYMSTVFSGSRIRGPLTKLIDVGDLYMNMLDSMTATDIGSGTGGTPRTFGATGSLPPIVNTIAENLSNNGDIVRNNITLSTIVSPAGILNMINKAGDSNKLLTEAVGPLNAMLTDWVAWMKSEGFVGNKGNYAYLNSAFRTQAQQEAISKKNPKSSATPGKSNHGWGIAIDFQFFKKDGNVILNYTNGVPNVKEGYNLNINEALVWLLENSYAYGWIIPENLRDDTGLEEFWHFEYHGTTAACILNKKNKIKGKVIDVSKPYKDIVTNPKDASGKPAKYDGCDFINVDKMDGTVAVTVPSNPNLNITPPSSEDIAFYSAVLTGLKAPVSAENLKFLYAWRQAENSKAAWNPFNTTKTVGLVSNFNCNVSNGKAYPVKNYANKADGIEATIKTINNGRYPKIVEGLQKDIGAENLSKINDELAIWGTGKLINEILGGKNLAPKDLTRVATQIVVC